MFKTGYWYLLTFQPKKHGIESGSVPHLEVINALNSAIVPAHSILQHNTNPLAICKLGRPNKGNFSNHICI